MANLYSRFTYDNSMKIRAAGEAITATETGSIILDLGPGLMEGYLVADITAIDTTTGDEAYTLMLEVSPDAAFGTAGNIRVAAELRVGGATFTAPNGAADTAGRFAIPFRNERNGTIYRYARLYTLVAGTSPSITFSAFLGKDK